MMAEYQGVVVKRQLFKQEKEWSDYLFPSMFTWHTPSQFIQISAQMSPYCRDFHYYLSLKIHIFCNYRICFSFGITSITSVNYVFFFLFDPCFSRFVEYTLNDGRQGKCPFPSSLYPQDLEEYLDQCSAQ